jgi:pimeloyl-ACP methyl ester carboxylesterase
MATVTYEPRGNRGFKSSILTRKGHIAAVEVLADDEPSISGDDVLIWNPVLLASLATHGLSERKFRRAQDPEKKRDFERAAKVARRIAADVAELSDAVTAEAIEGWCSVCWIKSSHVKLDAGLFKSGRYLCRECGAPTSECAVPKCVNFASPGFDKVSMPTFCAEHRNEIPSFEKMAQRLSSLDDAAEWFEFEKVNATRAVKIVVHVASAAAFVGPLAFIKAGQIGGAVGVGVAKAKGKQLAGAAARNYGLAWLGGGPIAAGGFGIAGGTLVVGAAGATLGGVVGARASMAYLNEDSSFRIVKLRDGEGPAVLLSSGFLTEGADGWGTWRKVIDERYPDSPVYRVFWGSKELRSLTSLLHSGGLPGLASYVGNNLARRALKKAAVGPVAAAVAIPGLIANPWNQAKSRSEKTARIIADLIARTDDDQFILVGHSLGARVMVNVARLLGQKAGDQRIREMHLLGGAMGSNGDWRSVHDSVSGRVWNYYSTNDRVLRFLYRSVGLGKSAIGLVGIKTKYANIRNLDVTEQVKTHSDYFDKIKLARERSTPKNVVPKRLPILRDASVAE